MSLKPFSKLCICLCAPAQLQSPLTLLEWSADIHCQKVSAYLCLCVCYRMWMWTWACTCMKLVNECTWVRERGWSGVRHSGHTISLLTNAISSSCLGVFAVIWVKGGRQDCYCCQRAGEARNEELGGGQANCRGRWQHSHAESNQQVPTGNPSFSTQAIHLSFPLKPPSASSYSLSENSRGRVADVD